MKSVERVRAALLASGVGDVVVTLPASARTAQMAADALSQHLNTAVPVGAIVKSLVFVADAQPVLVLVAGDRRGDPGKLKAILSASQVTIASPEIVRSASGYAIGGVPPIGHATRLPTLIDASLSRFETVYASAGHPNAVFPILFTQLLGITSGRLADVAGA